MQKKLLATLVLVALLPLAGVVMACSVPVFRYGLEHWAADAFQVTILHAHDLTADEQALVQKLTKAPHANLKVKVVVDASAASPILSVKQPPSLAAAREIWRVPLNEANVNALLDSPLRKEIAQRLGDGDSAVWVLLESGDKAKDDAMAKALDEHLTHVSETLALPQLDDQDIKNGLVSVPDEGLRLSFPMLRLSRSNTSETFLMQALLGSEADLKDLKEPMAFPIFGRGRVLYALVGRGISLDNVTTAAKFLIGSCSCQIKEQNPGSDLLLNADWKALLKADALLDEELPKLSDIEGLKPILVPIPERPASSATPVASASPSFKKPAVIVGIIVLLLALVAWTRRSKNAV